MSLSDDLQALEDRLTARLNELRPLVEEYEELERLAERLGLEAKPATPGRRAAPAKPAGRAARRSSVGRRRPGRKPQRREQVLQLVRQQPGTTVPEIAKTLGVDPTGLYRVVRQLEREGAISKAGMALTPVT